MKTVRRPLLHYEQLLGEGSPFVSSELRTIVDWCVEQEGKNPDKFIDYSRYVSLFGHSASMLIEFLVGYQMFGQQVFVTGPRLQKMFEHTSIEHIPESVLKAPYPVFYIALADCPWRLYNGTTQGDLMAHTATGVYVLRDDDSNRLKLFIWGKDPKTEDPSQADDAVCWYDMDLKTAFATDGGLEGYIQGAMRDAQRDASTPGCSWSDLGKTIGTEAMLEAQNRHHNTLIRIVRVVINMMIYLQFQGALVEADPEYGAWKQERKEIRHAIKRTSKPKKVRVLQKRLARIPIANVVWLGRDIEQGKDTLIETDDGEKRLVRQHWRKGHWWPRLDNLEARERFGLHWRKPTLVNRHRDDVGEAAPHTYKFESDRDEIPT